MGTSTGNMGTEKGKLGTGEGNMGTSSLSQNSGLRNLNLVFGSELGSYFATAAMGRVDFVIGVVGALLLAHGAVSTVQYRGALKIREEDFTSPPLLVLVQVAISLVLCLWAALKVPGAFLPILPDAKENMVTELPANLDSMIFNHRGKLFPPQLVEAKFS